MFGLFKKKYNGTIAIISDIQGNYEALESILADADMIGVSDYVFLGNIIGHLPFGDMCVDRISKMGATVVRGPLDTMRVFDGKSGDPGLDSAVSCNARKLNDGQWIWLGNLSSSERFHEITFSFLAPVGQGNAIALSRVHDFRDAFNFMRMSNVNVSVVNAANHYVVYDRENIEYCTDSVVSHERSDRVIIGVSPAGLPKSTDYRAKYCVYSPARMEVSHRYCDYDFKSTQHAITKEGLHEIISHWIVGRFPEYGEF